MSFHVNRKSRISVSGDGIVHFLPILTFPLYLFLKEGIMEEQG